MSNAERNPPTPPTPPSGDTSEPYPPSALAWYVVIVLMLIYMVSFLDRQILGLLVKPMKDDLGINDEQMGFLMGPAFAVFYTIAGIPIGRWVDLWSRRWIIIIGQLFWSLMTAGCGMVSQYWHFVALRLGLGVGEATLSPAAYSIITDLFPRSRLGRALSVYSMGIYVGGGLSLVFGGWVVSYFTARGETIVPLIGLVPPWQMVFLIISLPAIPLTILLFTFKDVRRGAASGMGKKPPQSSPKEFLEYVSANRRTFIYHNVGFSLMSLSGYASSAWIVPFFQRVHHWEVGVIGFRVGMVTIIFGILGLVAAGWTADYLTKKGFSDAKMRVGMFVAWARIPFGIMFALMSDGNMALLWFMGAMFFASMPWGVAPAAIQEMMPATMRGQGSSVYLFVINLIGMCLGPYVLAVLTTRVFTETTGVREALLYLGTTCHVIAGILLWIGLKHYRRSLEYLKEWQAAQAA